MGLLWEQAKKSPGHLSGGRGDFDPWDQPNDMGVRAEAAAP